MFCHDEIVSVRVCFLRADILDDEARSGLTGCPVKDEGGGGSWMGAGRLCFCLFFSPADGHFLSQISCVPRIFNRQMSSRLYSRWDRNLLNLLGFMRNSSDAENAVQAFYFMFPDVI